MHISWLVFGKEDVGRDDPPKISYAPLQCQADRTFIPPIDVVREPNLQVVPIHVVVVQIDKKAYSPTDRTRYACVTSNDAEECTEILDARRRTRNLNNIPDKSGKL